MKITNIRARDIAIPLETPIRISTRHITSRHYLIVEVHTDDGNHGVGYAYTGTVGGDLIVAAVDDLFTPLLLRQQSDDILGIWAQIYQETLLAGRRGLTVRALSALDIALWDLKGKQARLPLSSLLGGGTGIAGVPAYASGGYYLQGETDHADAVRREIELNRKEGFTNHKIKVGGLSINEDADRVAAAIAAIDGTGLLALDANNGYDSVPEGLRAIKAFESAADGAPLWWFEEPFGPDSIDAHAALATRCATPIATGEIQQTRWDFRAIIEKRAADFIQVDVGVVGGISEYLRVARTAETFGLRLAPHWHANVHAHLALAAPNTETVEHFLIQKDIYNFEKIVLPKSRLRFDDGRVYPSAEPGIGVAFDPAALDEYDTARS